MGFQHVVFSFVGLFLKLTTPTLPHYHWLIWTARLSPPTPSTPLPFKDKPWLWFDSCITRLGNRKALTLTVTVFPTALCNNPPPPPPRTPEVPLEQRAHPTGTTPGWLPGSCRRSSGNTAHPVTCTSNSLRYAVCQTVCKVKMIRQIKLNDQGRKKWDHHSWWQLVDETCILWPTAGFHSTNPAVRFPWRRALQYSFPLRGICGGGGGGGGGARRRIALPAFFLIGAGLYDCMIVTERAEITSPALWQRTALNVGFITSVAVPSTPHYAKLLKSIIHSFRVTGH